MRYVLMLSLMLLLPISVSAEPLAITSGSLYVNLDGGGFGVSGDTFSVAHLRGANANWRVPDGLLPGDTFSISLGGGGTSYVTLNGEESLGGGQPWSSASLGATILLTVPDALPEFGFTLTGPASLTGDASFVGVSGTRAGFSFAGTGIGSITLSRSPFCHSLACTSFMTARAVVTPPLVTPEPSALLLLSSGLLCLLVRLRHRVSSPLH